MEDCTDCGACCIGTRVALNYLEKRTTPLDLQDGEGNLRRVDGHCVLLDIETRLCRDYEHRPDVCRRFERGSGTCRFMRARIGIDEEERVDWGEVLSSRVAATP